MAKDTQAEAFEDEISEWVDGMTFRSVAEHLYMERANNLYMASIMRAHNAAVNAKVVAVLEGVLGQIQAEPHYNVHLEANPQDVGEEEGLAIAEEFIETAIKEYKKELE